LSILLVGLLVVASASIYMIDETAKANARQMCSLFGQEVADRLVDPSGVVKIPPDLGKVIDRRKDNFSIGSDFTVVVTNTEGDVIYSRPPMTRFELNQMLNSDMTESVRPDTYVTATPIMNGDNQLGKVIMLQTFKPLIYSPKDNIFLTILLGVLMILGWLTIYLLSRKLSKPIRDVALAAHSVSMGHYDIQLNGQVKEREIAELVVSFKEMANRLKQLEETRTVMLAGVTHELKTPVTSIKGLIHAVKEDVVEGQEKEEFLEIALKEANRMQSMIGDLLEYNTFAIGYVGVQQSVLDANRLIAEIVYQWGLVQEDNQADVAADIPAETLYINGDAARIQQIMINLLNNSLQAGSNGDNVHITVTVRKQGADRVEIEVKDNGVGIPAEEQPYIFERFFRGEMKKLKTRGLGLGLTFSQMLAQAQGGELKLRESLGEGTVFVLSLPLAIRGKEPNEDYVGAARMVNITNSL